jgi:hypothetical protein
VDETISLENDYLCLAADIGQRLMRMGGRELVEEAVKVFGNR